ncbi:MAG TPA: hypothetical protein VFR07_17340 [Mycobacteriales bacterium]|nr:hypothetical protein [Mycobacteriales bacterium]
MDRSTLDRAIPMIYGALVALSAVFFSDALIPIAVGGALLLAVYYAVIRPRMLRVARTGRGRP